MLVPIGTGRQKASTINMRSRRIQNRNEDFEKDL